MPANLYDPAKVGEIVRDSANGRRRYQIHRTPGTNNEESPWLQNADELETWLISRGVCKDERWNLETPLPTSVTPTFAERMRHGGKRTYRCNGRTSDWLHGGAHLEVWLKSIGAYSHLPDLDEVKADTSELEAEAATCILTGAPGEDPDDCTTHDHETEETSGEDDQWYIQYGTAWSGDPEPAAEAPAWSHGTTVLQADAGGSFEQVNLPLEEGFVTHAVEAVVDADTGELIPREIDGFVIHQRAKDGYVNATAMCKAAGKLVADYTRLASTQLVAEELVSLLSEEQGSMGIPIDPVIYTQVTGPNEYRGTWIHPDLAVNLATWCSSKFAVRVSRWVRDWLTTGKTPAAPAFQIPQTYAEALRLAADTTEANERLTRTLGLSRQIIGDAAHKLRQAEEDLDVKEEQREAAVTEKQEEERKAAAMARAVALEAESKILTGWVKEVQSITGVGPRMATKIPAGVWYPLPPQGGRLQQHLRCDPLPPRIRNRHQIKRSTGIPADLISVNDSAFLSFFVLQLGPHIVHLTISFKRPRVVPAAFPKFLRSLASRLSSSCADPPACCCSGTRGWESFR